MCHTEPVFTMKTPFQWMRKFLPPFQGLRRSSLNSVLLNRLNSPPLLYSFLFVRHHLQSLGDSHLLGNLPLNQNSELPLLFPLLCLFNSSRGPRRSLRCLEMYMGRTVTLLTSWNLRTKRAGRNLRRQFPNHMRTLLTLPVWFSALAIDPRQVLRVSLSHLSPPLLLSWRLRVALIVPLMTLLLIGCAGKGEYISFCSSWLRQSHQLLMPPQTPKHGDTVIWLTYP